MHMRGAFTYVAKPLRGCPARRRSALAVFLTILVSAASPANAAGPSTGTRPAAASDQLGPLDLVKVSVARVLAILQSQPAGTPLTPSRRAEIRRAAEDFFDFDEMARRALGPHWKDRSPSEQSEFTRLFVDVLERSYVTVISNQPVTAVTYQGESINEPLALVRSRVVTDRRGERVELLIEYRLIKSGGRWQAFDVMADGVSLISSYRGQFDSIIRASSFAQLLERLRSREAQVFPRQGPRWTD